MKVKHYFYPLVSCHQIQRPVRWAEHFDRRGPLEVEIGFGLGEFLVRSALAHPQFNYVGIEQHWERICKTLTRIRESGKKQGPGVLKNVRLVKIDARVALERLFLPGSIDYVHCLFPCPWPKDGHVKHRLFSSVFLKLLNSRLKPKGQVKIVTDSLLYKEWILEQLEGTGFKAGMRGVEASYDTKFERKWQREGQKEFYEIVLSKTKFLRAPVKKDTALKAYRLKKFDPQQFHFQNQTGDISVIFKELLFDPLKNKAMIHLVVAEDTLTQHFWVAVMKKDAVWRVCKADGQTILPTAGLARALELVYEAGKDQE